MYCYFFHKRVTVLRRSWLNFAHILHLSLCMHWNLHPLSIFYKGGGVGGGGAKLSCLKYMIKFGYWNIEIKLFINKIVPITYEIKGVLQSIVQSYKHYFWFTTAFAPVQTIVVWMHTVVTVKQVRTWKWTQRHPCENVYNVWCLMHIWRSWNLGFMQSVTDANVMKKTKDMQKKALGIERGGCTEVLNSNTVEKNITMIYK